MAKTSRWAVTFAGTFRLTAKSKSCSDRSAMNPWEHLQLDTLFDDGAVIVVSGQAEEWADFSRLTRRELAAVDGAVTSRRLEYTAVRCMAREALARLGIELHELLNDDDRSPIWPSGVV